MIASAPDFKELSRDVWKNFQYPGLKLRPCGAIIFYFAAF